MLVFLIIVSIWNLTGYLFWRAVYYGGLKYWYTQYKIAFTDMPPYPEWRKIKPAVIVTGPINLIIILTMKSLKRITFAHGITLYFKMPADAEKFS